MIPEPSHLVLWITLVIQSVARFGANFIFVLGEDGGTFSSDQYFDLSAGTTTVIVKLKALEYDSEQEGYLDSEGHFFYGESYDVLYCEYDEHDGYGYVSLEIHYDFSNE